MRRAAVVMVLAGLCWRGPASAGPETSIREFASTQIKKGVRSIGLGGDGATFGNYALEHTDPGSALMNFGVTSFSDTGNAFTFWSVGFKAPTFWDDAGLYVVALWQTASAVDVWSLNPKAGKPSSVGDGTNQAVFVRFSKPLSRTVNFGVMLAHEVSQMTLLPRSGAAPIVYRTSWLPSGGLGVTWEPFSWLMGGLRIVTSHDHEVRTEGSAKKSGLLRSYEYRAGVAVRPWKGGILDLGVNVLDRSSAVDGTSLFTAVIAGGIEQELLERKLSLRAGWNESGLSAGLSATMGLFRVELAYLNNVGGARLGDLFGVSSHSVLATLLFDYWRMSPKTGATGQR